MPLALAALLRLDMQIFQFESRPSFNVPRTLKAKPSLEEKWSRWFKGAIIVSGALPLLSDRLEMHDKI